MGDWVEINGVSGEVWRSAVSYGAAGNGKLDRLRASNRAARDVHQTVSRLKATILIFSTTGQLAVGMNLPWCCRAARPLSIVQADPQKKWKRKRAKAASSGAGVRARGGFADMSGFSAVPTIA